MAAQYTHGHHPSVLRSHTWRTAANSAAYLLPSIKPHMHILDVGCGPGTITLDFAALVPEGRVIGIDQSAGVLEQASEGAKARGLTNVEFTTGDVFALKYPDATFDIVHCHQVMQHVPDPVAALKDLGFDGDSDSIKEAAELQKKLSNHLVYIVVSFDHAHIRAVLCVTDYTC